ncbi:MAG: N-acetylmuramoyl-L-alanine amidase [Butyrivibrio sp.]|nr:N-acetylmuramoyl-L-alanine amidase [Butyrivibrio sp.]
MTNQDMKKMAIRASVFAVLAIGLMVHRSATKHIMITDAAQAHVDRGSADDSYSLLIDRNVPAGKENTLIIPLSKSVSSDDIVLEDRYIDNELHIYIDSREEDFYMDNPVQTDLDILTKAECIKENDTGSVCLNFTLDGLYVNESSLTDSSTIEVRFSKPRDRYDRIAVVDPACGGSDTGYFTEELSEKDITLEVAAALREKAAGKPESDIRIFYTRLGDIDVSAKKRQKLIRDSGADLYVKLTCNMDSDRTDGITAYYNDRFFIRGFSNADFANLMEKSCLASTGAEAGGVKAADPEDEMIMECSIPAVCLDMGNLQGFGDSRRLAEDDYKEKMAEGLYQALLQAFEEMK